jgi:uncharacterized membrane protein
MKLSEYKLIFAAAGLIAILLFASPTLALFIKLPQGEAFSELFLLGPAQKAEDYPYNIVNDQTYSVFAGVTNHLGTSAYYILHIKLANRIDPLPNDKSATPSTLPSLYECRFQIQNEQTWQNLISFKISNAHQSGISATIGTLTINNVPYTVNKQTTYNSTESTLPYRLIFELWLFNPQSGSAHFNSRFVSLQLNYTQPA